MRIEGAPEVGTKLLVHLTGNGGRGMSFKPKVLAATPGKELRWLGKLGLRSIAAGEHFFILTTNDDGSTRTQSRRTLLRRTGRAGKTQLSEQWRCL
jgi:hypothetical protein